MRNLSPTNITFDSDVFVWGILSLCQVHNALPNSLNTGDAGQIKDLNIEMQDKSKTSHTVGFVGSVRSSLPLCPQILAYLFVMVLDLIFIGPR